MSHFNLILIIGMLRLQESNEIMNAIGDAFIDVGHEETAIIVRSNNGLIYTTKY